MAERKSRKSVLHDEDSEDFPAGWEDGIVVGTIRRNQDGSITISCQIDVHGDGHWWTTNREMRLRKNERTR